MVIIDHTIYLEGIKSLLSDSIIFTKLLIDEDRWINYIINLESTLKDRFKVLKNEKILKKNLIVFLQLELHILYGNPKVHKTVINNTPRSRPFLSIITPTYLLAKYLNPIFLPLTTNEFTGKKSSDFTEEDYNYNHNL